MPIANIFYDIDQKSAHGFNERRSADALSETGPILSVKISITPEDAALMKKEGISVPDSRSGQMLIDTGSGLCAIDQGLADDLDARVIDFSDVSGATGSEIRQIYAISLEFTETKLPPLFVRCVGLPLSRLGIAGVIGREVLKDYELFYNGPLSQITLAT